MYRKIEKSTQITHSPVNFTKKLQLEIFNRICNGASVLQC